MTTATVVSNIINDINKFVDTFVYTAINNLKKIFNGNSDDKICKKSKKKISFHASTKSGRDITTPKNKQYNPSIFSYYINKRVKELKIRRPNESTKNLIAIAYKEWNSIPNFK